MTTTEVKTVISDIRDILKQIEQCANDAEQERDPVDHCECLDDLRDIANFILEIKE